MHRRGVARTMIAESAPSVEALFELHGRQVLAYCVRRTANLPDAEDAASETFIVAWRRRERIPPGDGALPWLLATARRVLANQRRAAARRLVVSVAFDGLDVASTAPEASVLGQVVGPAMLALGRLRADDQELLRLVAWEDLDHAAVGRILGITTNAVAIRLHRVRRRFEEELRRGLDPAALKGIAGRRTSTRLKGRIVDLLRREPSE